MRLFGGALPERLARLIDLAGKGPGEREYDVRWHLGYDTEHGRIRRIDPRTLYECDSFLRGGRESGIEGPKVKRPLEELVIE